MRIFKGKICHGNVEFSIPLQDHPLTCDTTSNELPRPLTRCCPRTPTLRQVLSLAKLAQPATGESEREPRWSLAGVGRRQRNPNGDVSARPRQISSPKTLGINREVIRPMGLQAALALLLAVPNTAECAVSADSQVTLSPASRVPWPGQGVRAKPSPWSPHPESGGMAVIRNRGANDGCVRQKYPELCRAIGEKIALAKQPSPDHVRGLLENALHERPAPTPKDLSRRLGDSNSTVLRAHEPALCDPVMARRRTHVLQRKAARGRHRCENAASALALRFGS